MAEVRGGHNFRAAQQISWVLFLITPTFTPQPQILSRIHPCWFCHSNVTLSSNRQRKSKCTPLAQLAFDFNGSALEFNQTTGDRQP